MTPRAIVPLVLMLAALSACTVGGQRSVSAENDRLRRRVLDLEAQAAVFQGERDELAAKLREAHRLTATPQAEALAALPVAVRVDVDALSGFDPADTSLPATNIVFAVRPLDGRGRFVQVAGSLVLEALAMPAGITPGPTGEPRRLLNVTIPPADLREAYREGLGGARYEVSVPLDAPVARGASGVPTLVLRVELHDGLMRTVLRGERSIQPRQ